MLILNYYCRDMKEMYFLDWERYKNKCDKLVRIKFIIFKGFFGWKFEISVFVVYVLNLECIIYISFF